MFVRTTVGHNKDGSTRIYLYLVRGYRVNGKVRQETVASLGRLDILQAGGGLDKLIASLARYSERCWVEAEALPLLGRSSRHYGAVLVFWRLWEKLGLHQLLEGVHRRSPVEFPVEEALFGMVLARLLEPDSKLGNYEWLKEEVYRPEFQALELHHLYRALDFLDEHIRTVEEGLFLHQRGLFGLEVELVFFDTTSVYFEGEGPQGLAERGYSRDRRPDRVQVLLGLVMTREGIPVAHHLFPGNTADIVAFRHAVADLRRRFAIGRVVVVADRGVVSEPLLKALDQEGMGYIVGIPLKRWRAADRVLRRAGRYHQAAENLRVKEVWEGDQRYVLCHNPEREERDARERAGVVAALEKGLEQGGLEGLAKQKGYRRYLKVQDRGQAAVDWEKVKRDQRYDGKFLLRSNTQLSPAEIAVAYKELWRVEHAFRELKTGLEVRPVHHWTPPRVRGHFAVCFLALVLEATLAQLLRQKGCAASYQQVLKDLQRVKAAHLELSDKPFLLRMELQGQAYDAFQAVGLRPPPRLQPLS